MSIRAYRIISMQSEGQNSFDLYHHRSLVAFLEERSGLLYQLNQDGFGVATVSVKTLEEALRRAKELRLRDYVVKALKEDIAFARACGSETVSYECW